MIILGIESSCDETAAAIVQNGNKVLSSVVQSQDLVHEKYGGIVPELASRNHIGNIFSVLNRAISDSNISLADIDGVAATYGPGLIGSLLVGLTMAKAVAFSANKKFIGVHHIEGHLHASHLQFPNGQFPSIGLVVSGGHTTLYKLKQRGCYEILGQTKDDAAGEAFDKGAKTLGLKFPGGPEIDRLAQKGDPSFHAFPRSQMPKFDFSFSGLKTSLAIYKKKYGTRHLENICASYQSAIVDMLVDKTLNAAQAHKVKSITVCGGVARNSALRKRFKTECEIRKLELYIPEAEFCTDNAVMIALAGYEKLKSGLSSPWSLAPKAYIPLLN
ncbi:MAG: tRNA (adenosine(37)-N6)-threonylcarbamoyltransferase complex transferase subunit TsaD [Bdellovibrionales bacterium]|nr:tRNA (adenosine(37)-N6)-threonylcarbamoyltransferase complex transferase subunit TsaD [Bdellovibrionales bacterium]